VYLSASGNEIPYCTSAMISNSFGYVYWKDKVLSASDIFYLISYGLSVFSAVSYIRILPFQVLATSGFAFIRLVFSPEQPKGDP